jgi:hypothetical protein
MNKDNCAHCNNKLNQDYYYGGKGFLPKEIKSLRLTKKPHGRFEYYPSLPNIYNRSRIHEHLEDMEEKKEFFFCSDECYTIFMNKKRMNKYFFYLIIGAGAFGIVVVLIKRIYEMYIDGTLFKDATEGVVLVVLSLLFCSIIILKSLITYFKILGYREEKKIYEKDDSK